MGAAHRMEKGSTCVLGGYELTDAEWEMCMRLRRLHWLPRGGRYVFGWAGLGFELLRPFLIQFGCSAEYLL